MSEQESTLDEFAGGTTTDDEQEDSERRLPEIDGIPEDWELVTVEDISTDLLGGGTPSKSNDEYWNGTIPWASVKDLSGIELSDTEDHITETAIKNSATNLIPANSIIISTRMTVGEPFLNKVEMAINQDMKAVIPDHKRANTLFLVYSLWDKDSYLKSLGRGTTVDGITTRDLSLTHLGLSSIEEQREIATVLYTVDQAIEKTDEIIEQTHTIKEGVKNDLLTGGLRDTETMETRLGPVSTKIPVHWDTRRIGDLFTDRQLGTDKRGTTDDCEEIDLIKMGNLNFGTWDFSKIEKIEKDPQLLKEAGLQQGDLLFNTRNTPELVGKTAVWEFDHEAVYDNNLLRLRFGEHISSGRFVNAYLSSNIGRRQLRSRVHGTTSVAAIYWTDLQQVEIPIPPKEEQGKIVDTLQELDRTRKHNETYRNRLQRLKKGLMQDLLSGTVRTTDTNITVPDKVAQHG